MALISKMKNRTSDARLLGGKLQILQLSRKIPAAAREILRAETQSQAAIFELFKCF